MRLRFASYVKLGLEFQAGLEALLYENGTVTNDTEILKDFLSSDLCEVVIENGQIRVPCVGNFRFTSFGETEICLSTNDKISGACASITVLGDILISNIRLSNGRSGMFLYTSTRGSIYNVSFYFDNELVATVDVFGYYGEILSKYCRIDWEIRPRQHAVLLNRWRRKLLVRVTNPLNPLGVTKEKLFYPRLPRIYLRLFSTSENAVVKVTVQAKGVVTGYEGLRYKWSLRKGTCDESVQLLKSITTGKFEPCSFSYSSFKTRSHACPYSSFYTRRRCQGTRLLYLI